MPCAPNGYSCALSFHIYFLSQFHAAELSPLSFPGVTPVAIAFSTSVCSLVSLKHPQEHQYNCKKSKLESFPKWPCHSMCSLIWASPLFLTLLLIKGSWFSPLLTKGGQCSSASFNHRCRWKSCQGSFFCWKPWSRAPLNVGQGYACPSHR